MNSRFVRIIGALPLGIREYIWARTLWMRLRRTGIASLDKSQMDDYAYALGLRDGTVIHFERAILSRDRRWVHLKKAEFMVPVQGDELRESCGFYLHFRYGPRLDRGVDVRISDIVWCADDP